MQMQLAIPHNNQFITKYPTTMAFFSDDLQETHLENVIRDINPSLLLLALSKQANIIFFDDRDLFTYIWFENITYAQAFLAELQVRHHMEFPFSSLEIEAGFQLYPTKVN